MTSPLTDPQIKNYVKCSTACGFEAKCDDPVILQNLHDEHVCETEFTGPFNNESHWTENVFSIWTVFIVIALGVAALEIVKALNG